jgi:hypothetical protein
MFAYQTGPIDVWTGWLTEAQYLDQLAKEEEEGFGSSSSVAKYEELRSQAFDLAKKAGWEGDIRQGPFIAGLPTDSIGADGKIMVAWKQDNNGTTFVVSPIKLPWLD